MQRFGIYSPVLGVREDVPSILLQQAYTPDQRNVLMIDGEIHRAGGSREYLLGGSGFPTSTPDGLPVLKYHLYTSDDQRRSYLLAFTARHIYQWFPPTKSFRLLWTTAATVTAWSVCTYNSLCFAVNGIDPVLSWDQRAAAFTPFSIVVPHPYTPNAEGAIQSARLVFEFNGRLFVAAPTVSGNYLPWHLYWSVTGDHSDWLSTDDAGSAVTPGADTITAVGVFQDFLIIGKERSMHRMWATGSDLIFGMAVMTSAFGCTAPDSMIQNADGLLAFLATDRKIRIVGSGAGDFPVISDAISPDLRRISSSLMAGVRATYIPRYDLLAWAMPIGSGVTGNNTIYAVRQNVWTKHDLAVTAFGTFDEDPGWTIDTIPYAMIDAIGWPTIDNPHVSAEFWPVLYGSASGWTHELFADQAASLDGYAVLTTDLMGGQALNRNKRLLEVTAIFRMETTGTARIHVKRDQEASWQLVGTVDLTDGTEFVRCRMPTDLLGKHFYVRVGAENHFRFVGMEFGYVDAGER